MEDLRDMAEQAVRNHQNHYSCSAAVLMAFAGQVGLDESEARRIATPYAGGRMGKCGAVLAAEYVLGHCGLTDSDELVAQLEERFIAADKGSVLCNDLRGKTPGTCRACVTDAARILADMLSGTSR